MDSDKHDDFIDLLTSQTFDLAERRSQLAAVSCDHLVDSGLESNLVASHISYWHASYDDQLQSFRMKVGTSVVDFPRNWSIFSEIFGWMKESTNSYIELNAREDSDQLYAIINQVYSAERFYFVVHENHVLLVADGFGDSRVRDILQEYCCPPLPVLMAA